MDEYTPVARWTILFLTIAAILIAGGGYYYLNLMRGEAAPPRTVVPDDAHTEDAASP